MKKKLKYNKPILITISDTAHASYCVSGITTTGCENGSSATNNIIDDGICDNGDAPIAGGCTLGNGVWIMCTGGANNSNFCCSGANAAISSGGIGWCYEGGSLNDVPSCSSGTVPD